MMKQFQKVLEATLALALAGSLTGAAGAQRRPLVRDHRGSSPPAAPPPAGQPGAPAARAHPNSNDADAGYGPLTVNVTSLTGRAIIFFSGDSNGQDMGRLFPEWQPVGQPKPVVQYVHDHRGGGDRVIPELHVGRSYEELEGVIPQTAHVSFEDFPTSHYTHDFCFKVIPDPGFEYLLAEFPAHEATDIEDIHIDKRHPRLPQHTYHVPAQIQQYIEVEWECGLGQNNIFPQSVLKQFGAELGLTKLSANPAREPNMRGESFGLYSTGHRQGALLWNWPTAGDWVHVDGLWIWDRGHPPAETEIHPPRLVAVRRRLPAVLQTPGAPSHYSFATRADIFASGDDSALWNNRPDQPFFVQKVPMSEKDYVFNIDQPLPRPPAGPPSLHAGAAVQLASFAQVRPLQGIRPGGGQAQLAWRVERQPGDTYPGEAIIQPFPDGEPGHPTPHVRVTIPWKTQHAPDTAVFARTLYLYWSNDAAHGVASSYKAHLFRVTLDNLKVINPQGEYWHIYHTTNKDKANWRIFVEVGGQWYFLNDLVQPKPLEGGLDQAQKNQVFPINRSFLVYAGDGDAFRVHADGWEADGINMVMGRLINQYDQDRVRVEAEMNAIVLTMDVYQAGSRDDPLGEVNQSFDAKGGFGIGTHTDSSFGGKQTDDPSGDTDPNDSYRLTYHIEAIPLP